MSHYHGLFLLLDGKTVKIGNICVRALLSFTFELIAKMSEFEYHWAGLSLYHYLSNIVDTEGYRSLNQG